MAGTDSPLKDLVHDFAPDFAAWLLNVERSDIVAIHAENVELPAGKVWSDTVFLVTLSNGQTPVLHIEFQGPRSERPMPGRMLDYMSRLAQQEWSVLCSVVIYVGDGAGIRDTGHHRVLCPDGEASLTWRYRVIRLWQMTAEELLSLKRPALLALLGQTHIALPEQVIPEAVTTISQVVDYGERVRLFDAFTSLMRDEEILTMAERLIEAMDEGLMTDTPFLRRAREKGRAEGRIEGRAEGRIEGRAEGRIEGLRTIILDVLAARLKLTIPQFRRIQGRVETLSDETRLRGVLQTVILANDVAEVEAALSEKS
jgi:predicted transposase YdaD